MKDGERVRKIAASLLALITHFFPSFDHFIRLFFQAPSNWQVFHPAESRLAFNRLMLNISVLLFAPFARVQCSRSRFQCKATDHTSDDDRCVAVDAAMAVH